MPTQIANETSNQLRQQYLRVQKQFASQPEMTNQVWEDALNELQQLGDFQNPTVEDIAKAHSFVSILEQVLTSASARTRSITDQ